MKLHFEDPYASDQVAYQRQAIEAVADLFRGQETCRTEFTVTRQRAADPQALLGLSEDGLGIGNRLQLLPDELHANLTAVQLRNGLPPSPSLASTNFTVEMETGTGKTYVYLRTIFELHARYGFTKFVIVVPSVAIKEGVYHTLGATESHFRGLYANTPFEYFLYDSAKLGQVRNFATSATLQIMVVTVGAINKQDVNNLYKETEKTGGEKPIDLIRATRPFVIVDEPQSVDGGLKGSGKKALDEMHPLCTLRYSATHADKHHMLYRLDAVDAYERQLVKQIEVASVSAENAANTPYVRLVSVDNRKGLTAKIEVDVQQGAAMTRAVKTVRPGDLLEQLTGRAIYTDVQIGDMSAAPEGHTIEVRGPNFERTLAAGEAMGGVDEDAVKRLMIRRTIEQHLEKELRLAPLGIKVLSLFFIDAVEHYRRYAADGTSRPGKYAEMFEEEYRRAATRPKFSSLFAAVDVASEARAVHDGYFSIDRKGVLVDTADNNQANRDNAERAYALIMRRKEELLSFSTRLKFIFSHSALREGWDNPNVFQLCALREMGTERERRQTIGRGLRLCVDQTGARRRGFDINTLTVVATERYEEFAANLQREIEADTGVRFGVVERHEFAAIPVVDAATGVATPLGLGHSETLWTALRDAGYVSARGEVQDALRSALRTGTVELPAGFEPQRAEVTARLRKLAGSLNVRNADERRTIPVRRAILDGPEFRALWDRVKHRTTYRVEFDNAQLVADCIEAVRAMPPVAAARVVIRTAKMEMDEAGVRARAVGESAPVIVAERDVELPDVLTVLQDATQLTRRTLARVLVEGGRLGDFARNPQQFISLATEVITRTKRLALVDGIRYRRLGGAAMYAQELFAREELTGYLKNLVPSTKSPYEQVVHDSGVESDFARQLESSEVVKVYAKLPGWFTVPTPLGSYNPDWAVLVEDDGGERLYFVVETKGGLFADDLRERERAKVACGKAHFAALGEGATERPAKFRVTRTLDEVLAGDGGL